MLRFLGSCGNSLELNCILTTYSSSSLFPITDSDLIRKTLENISNGTFSVFFFFFFDKLLQNEFNILKLSLIETSNSK